jgi:hypothetical protein
MVYEAHAGDDYNLTLYRLQHMYHGQPYAGVDLNPMPESTLSPSQGLRIWPMGNRGMMVNGGLGRSGSGQIFKDEVNGFSSTSDICFMFRLTQMYQTKHRFRCYERV